VSKGKDTRVVFRRSRVFPKHPARDVLGLLRTNPGGLTWPSLLRTGRSLSTAGRGPTPDAPYLGYERPRPGDPNCGARSARRAPCGLGRQAKAANLPMATVPDPHSKTPLETPLVDRDILNIVLFLITVKSSADRLLGLACLAASTARSARGTLRPGHDGDYCCGLSGFLSGRAARPILPSCRK